MPDIPDSELLRINEESALVAPNLVEEARRRQDKERSEFGSCRSIFSILLEQGLIDHQVLEACRKSKDSDIPGEVTPHDPTVVLTGETPRPDKSPGEFSRVRTARRQPAEVSEAARDPLNRLGAFILIRVVGRGGMGKVYRAWDENVGRIVAVKVIDTDDTTARERFVREAQIAGRLSHPSIAGVYQAGEVGTRGYIAMQFIEGAPADATPLPIPKALEVIRDAARALAYAHREGVVHRDVKPANLLLDQDGRLFLTDFGLAKEVIADAGEGVSVTGTTFGTPQYMPPEQAAGEHDKIDTRSDVYSLGATLYSLLARRPPFTGQNVGRVLIQVIERKPLPVRRYNKEVSPALQLVVERAMAKDPARRYPSMDHFAEAIERLLREGSYKGRYGWLRLAGRRAIPMVTAVLLLAGAGRLGWSLVRRPSLPASPAAPSAARKIPPLELATAALADLESRVGTLEPSELRHRMDDDVLRPMGVLLSKDPQDLHARATRARAFYVLGEFAGASRELEGLDSRRADDHRPSFLRTLLALEPALATLPPLPALDSPLPEWADDSPVAWPDPSGLRGVLGMKVDPLLASEFARDMGTVRGVLALIEGRWADAADLLGAARRNSPLPVVTRAWRRAAYLARRFGEVVASRPPPGSREGVGAALALALESDSPGRELLKILETPGIDDEATLTLATALARLETGQDPRPWVTLGMNLLGTRLSDDPERRSILEAARLQWLSGSGEDDEARYEQAIRALGDEPRSWSGRLAAIDLRLGLGARLARRRADARARFEEAVRLSDRLSRQAPEWLHPRILRATARARLGQLEDAWSEIEALLGRPRVPSRVLLVASGVWLQRGERTRRSHLPWEGEARKAREWAMKVLSTLPDHPGALTLAAASSILLAQAEAAAGRDESELVDLAVTELGRALAVHPNSGEALFHRGRALFLRAEIARRAGRPSATDMVRSLEDLDLALRWMPDLLSARYMRGIARFTAGTYDGALDDWTLVLKADPSWDSGELQEWIKEARLALKK